LSELRQMAQVSAQMSQLHMATAFHFLISKRGGAFLEGGFLEAAAGLESSFGVVVVEVVAAAASDISTSSVFFLMPGMVVVVVCVRSLFDASLEVD